MPDKINCLIVDDEAAAHYVLINYIGCVSRLQLVGQCYNVLGAVNFVHEQRVDLVFMDINMPELNGFDFLKALATPPSVIFTTAYSEYALQSYEYGVIDYLLKPVDFARFLKAVDRYLAFYGSKKVIQEAPGMPQENTVVLKVDGEMETIKLADIIYTQSLGNYVKVFTLQRTYICSITTSELEKRLPADMFMRIHKSHIISMQKTDKFLNTTLVIGGKELPVGITYRRNLAERFR
jgi:DNA-binding LytR/AlgR family response regulator